MSEALIKVEGVSKKFCRSLKRSLWYGLRDIASEAVGASGSHDELRPDEFWAVRDVSFELRRGECLGLIGRNGAGKTTLLKMLNGLIKPDRGRIEMHGRVGALIALGAGFNPILTGRENIYVNGSVLGLSKKEIDAKLDDIIDFAGTGEFIDTPVQAYSSGMQVRLGFSIATALQPDVLLLDEVLAVGDAEFRAKCYNRIGSLQKEAAVIFVSHSMPHVARISSQVLVLAKGRTVCHGTPDEGVSVYETGTTSADSDEGFLTFAAPVTAARVGFVPGDVGWTQGVEIELKLECSERVERPSFYGLLYDASGAVSASFVGDADAAPLEPGSNRVRVRLESVPLATGQYTLGLSMHPPNSITNLLWSYKQAVLTVHSSTAGFSNCRLPVEVSIDPSAA
jgi:lipopolysaccharide transport system ATP-binding protein